MKKIRLLTISATCERGGSDINLLRLLKSLDKNEYEILHLIPYAGALIYEFKNAGVQVKVVDMPRIRLFKNPLRYITVLLKFFPAVFKIKKIIADNQIDVVCTSTMINLYGALAARLAHRPHILMVVEYLPVLRFMSHYFYFLSEKIACCSNMVSWIFRKRDKVLVRYPSVDLDEFRPDIDTQTSREKLDVHGKLVSMVTRLDRWKGVEVFIRAADYIKDDVRFILFGEIVKGKERYVLKLKKLIEQLGVKDKVTITTVEYQNTPKIIAASDIIVHASLRPEPFGLIIIEAMATGKPVIASKLGGPLEIISDGIDGVLTEPGNPKVLAQAISRLLKDPKSAKEIGLAARRKVIETFDLKEYAHSFDKIFKEALKGYSLKCACIRSGKNALLKISAPLVKLLVPFPPQPLDINKEMIRKILVIQLFGIGDLICSLPLLDVLKKYFNQPKITLLIDAKLSEVANLMECQDEIIGYKRGILSKPGLVFKIRKDKYDMGVVLNPLFQGAWMSYLSRAKYRLGYIRDYEGIQNIEKLSRLLTHPLLPKDKPMHDTQRYMEIIGFLGIEAASFLPKLNIPQEAVKWADEFLQNNGIGQNDFILGINPHAGWEYKCWDAKRFAEVADVTIDNYHAKVLFFGSSLASDMRRMDIISASLRHKVTSAAGKTDIPRLAALVKKCDALLTNDSGPMHLAWALGVNMVVLFGPSDINNFGYKRENIINLTADGPFFCRPCILNYQYKDNCKDNTCLKGIEVKDVIRAIGTLINKE